MAAAWRSVIGGFPNEAVSARGVYCMVCSGLKKGAARVTMMVAILIAARRAEGETGFCSKISPHRSGERQPGKICSALRRRLMIPLPRYRPTNASTPALQG